MYGIELTPPELDEIEALLTELMTTFRDANDPAFLDRIALYAQRLPARLRATAEELRLAEAAGVIRIGGFTVDDEAIGGTPLHWADTLTDNRSIREEFYFVLCATLVGDVFAWSSQQGGRIINEVVPIRGHEERQINSGSTTTLLWHTEDAFHPYRADYIGLMCLRNPEGTATTVACLDDVHIDEEIAKFLFEQRYVFHPDEAHMPYNRDPRAACEPGSEEVLQRSHARIERMARYPEKTAVLFGDPARPYVRLDSDAIDRDIEDPMAAVALETFMAEVDKHLSSVVLRPGDVIVVDNYRAVHGRQPFSARFDGRDRWLKRVNITRDLRRSRDARMSPTSRVVY